MRIKLTKTCNGNNDITVVPEWFEGDSFIHHTLKKIAFNIGIFDEVVSTLRHKYEELQKIDTWNQDVVFYKEGKTALVLLDKNSETGTYIFEVSPFFLKWTPQLLRTDDFWVQHNDQPNLSAKLSRLLQLLDASQAALVRSFYLAI
jgi:hypothetical protein